MNTPTIVTAFFDIGRDSWEGPGLPHYLKRTQEYYFECFERLLKLQNHIVVFTSNDLMDKFEEYNQKSNITIIGLQDWRRDIWPEFFEPIHNIHRNPKYQKMIATPWNPEYWSVDYVMVNMLKTYFVNYAIEAHLIPTDLVAWIDFGYAKKDEDVPSTVWNYNFDPEKIHFFSKKKVVPPHMDVIPIIISNDVWITGCHIVAGKKPWRNLLEYVYQNIHTLIQNNLIDDDQTILYMSYCLNPDLFVIHKIEENDWFCIFRNWNNEQAN